MAHRGLDKTREFLDGEMEKDFARGGGITETNVIEPDFRAIRPNAVERFKGQQGADVTDEGISVSSTTEPTQRRTGGFASFTRGLTPKKNLETKRPGLSFGLAPGKLPTFEELGGALSNIAAFIGGQARVNRAKGLTPGVAVTKKTSPGLTKTKLSTLTKLHETAVLAGDKDKAASLEERINAILEKGELGSRTGAVGDIDLDLEEIEKF